MLGKREATEQEKQRFKEENLPWHFLKNKEILNSHIPDQYIDRFTSLIHDMIVCSWGRLFSDLEKETDGSSLADDEDLAKEYFNDYIKELERYLIPTNTNTSKIFDSVYQNILKLTIGLAEDPPPFLDYKETHYGEGFLSWLSGNIGRRLESTIPGVVDAVSGYAKMGLGAGIFAAGAAYSAATGGAGALFGGSALMAGGAALIGFGGNDLIRGADGLLKVLNPFADANYVDAPFDLLKSVTSKEAHPFIEAGNLITDVTLMFGGKVPKVSKGQIGGAFRKAGSRAKATGGKTVEFLEKRAKDLTGKSKKAWGNIKKRFKYKKPTKIENPVLKAKRVGNANKIDHIKPNNKIAKEFPNIPLEHGFPDIFDNCSRFAEEFSITGGDGIKRRLFQVEVNYNGRDGVLEWIIEPNGDMSHRRFIGSGVKTGKPNQIPIK